MITVDNLNHFSFHYSFVMAETDYSYELSKTEDGFQLSYNSMTCADSVEVALTSLQMECILSILNQYNVEGWAGFHEEDPDCCDGDGFMVKMTISDCNMMAIGSNCYPEGYHQFKKELDEIVNTIIKGE